MSKQSMWEVYRYVLDDPTLDREAFEHSMQVDVQLALAVAEAVVDIERLRRVCHNDQALLRSTDTRQSLSSPTSLPTPAQSNAGWHWSSLAALAAMLLAIVGLIAYRLSPPSTVSLASKSPAALQQTSASTESIAHSWLVIHQESQLSESQLSKSQQGESQLSDSAVESAAEDSQDDFTWLTRENSNANDEGQVEVDDWLIEAAKEFYAEGVAS